MKGRSKCECQSLHALSRRSLQAVPHESLFPLRRARRPCGSRPRHPGGSFFELGPVTGVDGRGCGDDGKRGSRDGAVASLMKNAFAQGGSYVQVFSMYEPRQMGDCFVNTYRINGTAYREAKADSAKAAASSPRGDVVQSLRELQKLREEGVITPQEFDRLKTKIISAP